MPKEESSSEEDEFGGANKKDQRAAMKAMSYGPGEEGQEYDEIMSHDITFAAGRLAYPHWRRKTGFKFSSLGSFLCRIVFFGQILAGLLFRRPQPSCR